MTGSITERRRLVRHRRNAIAVAIVTLILACAARSGATEIASWVEDVDALMARLETTHPNMYTRHSPEEWRQAADGLKADLRTAEFHEAVLGMVELVAMLDDGHSRVLFPNATAFTTKLPILMHVYEDGVFVRTGLPSASEVFGKRIVAIEGVPIDEAMARCRPYVACDNDMGFIAQAPMMLRLPSVLQVVGITKDMVKKVRITAEGEDGSQSDYTIDAVRRDPWTDAQDVRSEWVEVAVYVGGGSDKSAHDHGERNYSFEHLVDERAVYMDFRAVRNEPDESFKNFCGRMFDFVSANDVDRLIIDIRENGGGNNYLNQPLIHGLIASPKLQGRGRVFVMIGRDTFSAAMSLAVDIERNTQAIFVGEPTGARPNHFGDATEFVLAKSGLRVRCSTLFWQNSDPRDQRRWIAPELPVQATFKSLVEHRDLAIEAILSYEGLPTGIGDDSPNTRWLRTSD